MKKLIIVGSGGFAKEIYSYLQGENCEILGYIDIKENEFYNLAYLGNEDNFDDKFIFQAEFIIAIGQIKIRNTIIKKLSLKSCSFFTFIHPSAFVAKDAKIGKGSIICPFAFVGANSLMGEFVICNIYSSIAHDCQVGNGSILSPYATLNGNAKIGKNCFVSTRSSILSNVILADDCTVSAHTVLSKSYEEKQLIFSKTLIKTRKKQ
ncbi:NeuD/PglB/VioB family sugar acetyltransferase [Campylobacter sp. CCS1377]|uniref:NeuD/PglB/VioB family sugar acetyltransferase n=1 Tax=Campylobacter sp. CCS1377 TaxID=3158229 RepID=A0AAU7E983_9BACT|nr:NeuD/PglB/VioB family sugar acetyltransferase [Campylobacter jejuni]